MDINAYIWILLSTNGYLCPLIGISAEYTVSCQNTEFAKIREKFMSTTKVKINIGDDFFEVEGSEEFVTKHLEEFKELLTRSKPNTAPRGAPKTKTKPKTKTAGDGDKKEGKSTSRSKSRAKKVTAERFDIHGGDKAPSLEGFLKEKNPGTANGPRIAVIGYYITEILGHDAFSEGQVEYAYKMLGLKRPNHTHQIMINNKNEKDYYEPIEENESSWRLTRAGEIFVADNLPSVDE